MVLKCYKQCGDSHIVHSTNCAVNHDHAQYCGTVFHPTDVVLTKGTELDHTVLYSTVLNCTVLDHTVLSWSILYCTVLYLCDAVVEGLPHGGVSGHGHSRALQFLCADARPLRMHLTPRMEQEKQLEPSPHASAMTHATEDAG